MMQPEVIFGTCDGTGQAINVCLGFVPAYVKVWNVEDAGGIPTWIEWHRGMEIITAIAHGIKSVDGGAEAEVAADGISEYVGGDDIYYDGATSNRWEDAAGGGGNSVEEVYVDGHYVRNAAGDAAYRCIGDKIEPNLNDGSHVKTPAGFTIGADGDINVNGEQLVWMAIRGHHD